jgi:hypothetical protein
MTFSEALAEQRWDDHRYYHHNRVNQALHLVSALSFIAAYVLLAIDPFAAVMLAWLVAMPSRQLGHFWFEPHGLRRGQPGHPRAQGSDQGRLQPAPQDDPADDLGAGAGAALLPADAVRRPRSPGGLVRVPAERVAGVAGARLRRRRRALGAALLPPRRPDRPGLGDEDSSPIPSTT